MEVDQELKSRELSTNELSCKFSVQFFFFSCTKQKMHLFVSCPCKQYLHMHIPQQMSFIQKIIAVCQGQDFPEVVKWLYTIQLPRTIYS